MHLTMLGTGMAVVRHCYNTCFLVSEGSRHLLVDGGGGNGILTQLELARVPWQDVRHIFVTHTHIDHILGIIWLMRLWGHGLHTGTLAGEVCIYGHDRSIAALRTLAHTLLMPHEVGQLDKALRLITLGDNEEKCIAGFDMHFFAVEAAKTRQFGFVLHHDNTRVVCCGDEPATGATLALARGCDWLLHEAFCLDAEKDIFRPHEKHHSTVRDACELAEALSVKNLVLYHTEDSHGPQRKALYLAEGKAHFSGALYVPDDLERIELTPPPQKLVLP